VRAATLVFRSLLYYWRTNLAVGAGVAVAVAVLAGALLVGDSVRASLRALVLNRLGNTGHLVAAGLFFREELSTAFDQACPLVALEGIVTHQASGRRAAGVQLFGIDERFWKFHGRAGPAPGAREIFFSESLAAELSPETGDGIILRVRKPSAIPAESLHGERDNATHSTRLSFAGAIPADALGEFSLRLGQGSVRVAFVSLVWLQQELQQSGKVNSLLVAAGESAPVERLARGLKLEDLGLRLKPVERGRAIQIETDAGLLSDELAASLDAAAARLGLDVREVFTYLANTIRAGGREIPYSLVTAVDLEGLAGGGSEPPILLNDWAARDLNAQAGQTVELEYYLWHPDGRLVTESARFRLAGVLPMTGLAADRELAPQFPGITDSDNVTDWDPPFPVDLGRIRPQDEDYWDRYRATPKAFVRLQDGQRLWQSRYGKLTSLRIEAPSGAEAAMGTLHRALREELDPLRFGLSLIPVREQALAASRGATDFGAYFVYFSFFLVLSALLLAGLFFRLGVEQRVRETGLLAAIGLAPAGVRRLFLAEGALLATAGAVVGALASAAYAAVMVYGLRTWWIGASGTEHLALHLSPVSVATGAAGGIVAALAAVWWTLRGLSRLTPRERLAGVIAPAGGGSPTRSALRVALASLALGLVLLLAGGAGWIVQVAAFFGAGMLLLAATLSGARGLLAWAPRRAISAAGAWGIARLGFRGASHRPGRSVLCIALVASATFIIVAVDAFRLEGAPDPYDPRSGAGGYPLMAESILSVYYNPGSPEGREKLSLAGLGDVEFVAFRLRPGDDISCLNLYAPSQPRVLGAPARFLDSGRFHFQASLAESAEERANPWLLLARPWPDGAIPAAVAANSLTYVLHRKLGEEFLLPAAGGRSIRFRLVAALADTVFQRELIISEENFLRLFPEQEGYRVFLIGAPPQRIDVAAAQIEDRLADYGFDVVPTADQLAAFHRVENTYLATFQTLGALGLLLGTAGLALVLLRNALERRRELALLQAVGYRRKHLALMLLAENLLLLVWGLAAGTVTALVAILPAYASRGGHLSAVSLAPLLLAVLAVGLVSSLLAVQAALRAPLLATLRSE
jgi:putative ABC transport system permease protein